MSLATYAVCDSKTRGRVYYETPSMNRSEFQRDKDRVIHSTAFRRLEYKTQVFVNHAGDLFRTRLTHSIEVAQIARSIARALGLNEDLTEVLALVHDIGHPAFGHTGQDALNACMKPYGGFEHNLQSLRIVDVLEERYPAFSGLNLCFETREGILKRCSLKNAALLGEIGERFLQDKRPTLEAQIVNLADSIAYNTHDLDDLCRSGIVNLEDIDVGIVRDNLDSVRKEYPGINKRKQVHETIRRIIHLMVSDLITQTSASILEAGVQSLQDVRNCHELAGFSEDVFRHGQELKSFLWANLYRHYTVVRASAKAKIIITELFGAFSQDFRLLPPQYQSYFQEYGHRAIADYISGMTDRFAIKEHEACCV